MTYQNSGPAPECLESAGSRAESHKPRNNNTATRPGKQAYFDQAAAAAFLDALGRGVFCFRTFDDNKGRSDRELLTIPTGTLEQCGGSLASLNAKGAGVYVVVNQGGNTDKQISRVRALFADFDQADQNRRFNFTLEPSLIIESSPGKHHVYWLADDFPVEQFRAAQARIIGAFGSDPKVKNESRVMRLPGFYHRKGMPFLARIIHNSGRRYDRATITEWLNTLPATNVAPEAAKAQPRKEDGIMAEKPLVPQVVGTPGKEPKNKSTTAKADPYAEKAFQNAIGAVMTAPEGSRNDELNRQAHGLYGLVLAGRLDEQEITRQLEVAGSAAGLSSNEIAATLSSARRAAQPRDDKPVQPQSEAKPPKPRRLTFAPASELTGFQEPTRWIVKGHIEAGNLLCFFAPPESLKTFVVLDIGLCVATGKDWHGHKVEAGPVLYICGEGRRGIGRRLQAWERHHGTKVERLFVSTTSAQILDASSLAELEAAALEIAEQHGNPALIIIDTLNRNFGPGDENSTTDMTRFIAALDKLRERLQCAVAVVHHTGLVDASRGRGNSALRGALDFEYLINRSQGATVEERTVELSCSKCKDHDRPATIAFKPVIVDLGMVDEDMQPITSLALERTEYTPRNKQRKLTPAQLIALESLQAVIGDTGDAHLETWRREAYARGISASDKPDAKQKAFTRAVRELLAAARIETRDDIYWPAGQSRTKPDIVPCVRNRTDTDTPLRGVSLSG